jgi:predicted lipid carrier protein YhbT
MADVIADFFAEFGHVEHEPMLRRATGTIRFDVEEAHSTQRWLVTMNQGDVAVSRRNAKADCVLRGDHASFERIVKGEASAMALLLRGVMQMELNGTTELLVLFNRYNSARVHRMRKAAAAPASAKARPKGRRK